MNPQEVQVARRHWPVLILVLMLLYPASFGPMVWLHDRQRLPQGSHTVLACVYEPLFLITLSGWDQGMLRRYVEFWESLP
jgi:hypothetical protein